MEKIALITDSTSGLTKEDVARYHVNVVRLKVIYKDREYIDGLDITPEEVYARLDEELPTTSMPSVKEVEELLERLVEEGYTHAIMLAISSGLSGTVNSFNIAAEHYQDKIQSFVFDSKIISIGVGLSVIETAKAIEAGKSFKEICELIPKWREKTMLYFTVDTLEYLIKGGRIGKVSGSIGQLLNLKPIIIMDEEGKYTTFTKVRGTKQMLNKLIQLGTEILDRTKSKIVIMTGTMQEEAKLLKEAFMQHPHLISADIGVITPVVGIHSGPRLLALVIMEE